MIISWYLANSKENKWNTCFTNSSFDVKITVKIDTVHCEGERESSYWLIRLSPDWVQTEPIELEIYTVKTTFISGCLGGQVVRVQFSLSIDDLVSKVMSLRRGNAFNFFYFPWVHLIDVIIFRAILEKKRILKNV